MRHDLPGKRLNSELFLRVIEALQLSRVTAFARFPWTKKGAPALPSFVTVHAREGLSAKMCSAMSLSISRSVADACGFFSGRCRLFGRAIHRSLTHPGD